MPSYQFKSNLNEIQSPWVNYLLYSKLFFFYALLPSPLSCVEKVKLNLMLRASSLLTVASTIIRGRGA